MYREVAKEYASYFDPNNIQAITNTLDNFKLNSITIKKGLVHSKKFTWEKTAKETLAVYNKL